MLDLAIDAEIAFEKIKRYAASIDWIYTLAMWIVWVLGSVVWGALLGGGLFNLLILIFCYSTGATSANDIVGPDPIEWIATSVAFTAIGVLVRAVLTLERLQFHFK